MGREINLDLRGFVELRRKGGFYIDKTSFIREWWDNGGYIDLICRPHGFGKTLNLDMMRCFLSSEYASCGEELFRDLEVWEDPEMREMQGKFEVVSVSFSGCKGESEREVLALMRDAVACATGSELISHECPVVFDREVLYPVVDHARKLHYGSCCKVILLLDDYDTPLESAATYGFQEEILAYMKSIYLWWLKTEECIYRAVVTGTVLDGWYGDLVNGTYNTLSTPSHQRDFGFTQEEGSAALAEYNLDSIKEEAEQCCGGITVGDIENMYRPSSFVRCLMAGEFGPSIASGSSDARRLHPSRLSQIVHTDELKELLADGSLVDYLDDWIDYSHPELYYQEVLTMLVAQGLLSPVGTLPRVYQEKREYRIPNLEARAALSELAGWKKEPH